MSSSWFQTEIAQLEKATVKDYKGVSQYRENATNLKMDTLSHRWAEFNSTGLSI
jgi:hypothetical protein